MSMLDEDEDYEDDVLYERRGTSVLGNARPELVVPTPWTSRRWTGAPNSRLLASSMRCDGEACLDEAEPRTRFAGRCLVWSPGAGDRQRAQPRTCREQAVLCRPLHFPTERVNGWPAALPGRRPLMRDVIAPGFFSTQGPFACIALPPPRGLACWYTRAQEHRSRGVIATPVRTRA